jgi:hypothetical protein
MIFPVELLAILALGASVFLTLAAIMSRSWLLMWLASLLSLVYCIVADFSIGPYVFLLTSLQLVAAIGMRRQAAASTLVVLLLVGIVIWVVIVPLQLIFGLVQVPLIIALPLVWLLFTVVLFIRGAARTE